MVGANGTGLLVPSCNRNITVIEPTSNHIDVTSPSIMDTATRVAYVAHCGSTPDARETTATRGSRSFRVAEKVGFEPTDQVTPVNALAGHPIRPLWHFSDAKCMGRAGESEVVDDWRPSLTW